MTDILPQIKEALANGPISRKIRSDAQNNISEPFYLQWIKTLEVTTAIRHSSTHSQITFRFPVQREYLNFGGTLHGAAQALFFDVCTTWLLAPIARKPDYWCSFGTSRNLNVTYLRPAVEGDILTLECETVNISKRLALLKGVLRRKDGAIVSTCEHQMYNVDADAGKL